MYTRSELIDTALRLQGYLLLPMVFDVSLVEAVRAELDEARLAEEQEFGLRALTEIGQDGYVCNVPGMGAATRALLDHEVIHAAVTCAIGVGARLSIAQGISLDAGKGRGQWPRRWHADLYQMREAMPDPTFRFGVNCLVVLDDMTESNGATCVVPGSHAHVNPRSEDGAELEEVCVSVAAPAGSLLLIDGGTWHAAGQNGTDKPRRVLKLLFVRKWIRPQLAYNIALPESVGEQVSPRVATMLGFERPKLASAQL